MYGADSVFSAEKDVVRGYMELIPAKDYLFARYMERDKKGYAGIRIFTWDGRPVKQFLLEGRCHFYEIDVRRNTIYAIDQNADFECVISVPLLLSDQTARLRPVCACSLQLAFHCPSEGDGAVLSFQVCAYYFAPAWS